MLCQAKFTEMRPNKGQIKILCLKLLWCMMLRKIMEARNILFSEF